jgi:hypothetical protein
MYSEYYLLAIDYRSLRYLAEDQSFSTWAPWSATKAGFIFQIENRNPKRTIQK